MKKISVVTLNKDRTKELLKCVRSVASQDYNGLVEHLIIGDHSQTLGPLEKQLRDINPNIKIMNWREPFPAEVNPIFAVSKIGYLRNLGIKFSTGDYIAQIGDDDFFEPNHLSSLARILDSDPSVGVAYSWRQLVNADGEPARSVEYPWAPNARHISSRQDLAHFIYSSLIRQGIREKGSAVVKDAVIASTGEEVFTVDTNCVLVRRGVHEKVPWHVEYSWREICQDYSDDHRFIETCYRRGIKLECSQLVTVNYTIGGVSNTIS